VDELSSQGGRVSSLKAIPGSAAKADAAKAKKNGMAVQVREVLIGENRFFAMEKSAGQKLIDTFYTEKGKRVGSDERTF
jgi:hypothetical protein